VDYRWDTLPDNRTSLILTVRDALTIAPVIAGNWQKPDVTAKLGITDRNFLGRNLRLELRAQYGESEPVFGEIKLIIPRQLLWRNMSIGAGIRKERVAGFNSDQAFISIVNPFHRDYQYTFSPDLEIGYNRSYTSPIFGVDPVDFQNVRHPFCFVRVTESVGTITHRRHQEEGFNLTGMIGAGFALTNETDSYIEGSIRAEYDKLISRRLQFGVRWEGIYTSSQYRYLWTRYGPAGIRGIEYGDLTGQLMQLASAGLYFTWIDYDFLAIEQSAFVQYATAWQTRGDWSSGRQHYAIGTGFQFTIPMYPAASLLISFSYNPNRKNWFYLEL
jgi:outer membrane protein assembly factor BamA